MPIITTNKQLRKRDPDDHYPTPYELVRECIKLLPNNLNSAFDPGAGDGVWGREFKKIFPDSIVIGCEIRDVKHPQEYDYWYYSSLWDMPTQKPVDVVIGNPWYKEAERVVRYSRGMLKEGGYLLFLLRLAFLESQKREKFWEKFPPKEVHVLSRRPSFTGDRKTDATAYAVYVWQKGYKGNTLLKWLRWNYED